MIGFTHRPGTDVEPGMLEAHHPIAEGRADLLLLLLVQGRPVGIVVPDLDGRRERLRFADRDLAEQAVVHHHIARVTHGDYVPSACRKKPVTMRTASAGHSSRSAWPMSGNSCGR